MISSVRIVLAVLLAIPFACIAYDVVIERNVNLRIGPHTQTEVIPLLKAGDQARLLDLSE